VLTSSGVVELQSEEHAGAQLERAFLGEVESLHLTESVPGEDAVGRDLVAPVGGATHLQRRRDALEPAEEPDAERIMCLTSYTLGPK
jgi:hypothetical protein